MAEYGTNALAKRSCHNGACRFRNFQIIYPVNEKDSIEGIELVEVTHGILTFNIKY